MLLFHFFLFFKNHFTNIDKVNNPPAVSDTADITSCPVRERAFAKSTEYESDETVSNFDREAIRINLLKETPPIPAPRQMISSGRIGIMNRRNRMAVSFFSHTPDSFASAFL